MNISIARSFVVIATISACLGCSAGRPGDPGRRGVGVEPPLGAAAEDQSVARAAGPASEASTSPEIIRYDQAAVRAAEASGTPVPGGPPSARKFPIAPAEPGVRIEEAQDPRIRAILPEARCEVPARKAASGPSPRCVVSLRRATSAVGGDVGGSLVLLSLIDWSVTSWTIPQLALVRAMQPLLTEKDPSVIVLSDARREALITVTGTIFRYDLESGRRVGEYQGPGGRIGDLAWSADGARALVMAGGGATLLDGEMRVVRRLAVEGQAVAIALSRDAGRAAVATDVGTIAVFDLTGAAAPRLLSPSALPTSGLAFTSAGLAAAGRDGNLRIFDPATGRESARTAVGVALTRLIVSPDGRRVATTGKDFAIRVHTLPKGKVVETLAWHRANFAGVVWGAGNTIVAVDNDGELAAWDMAN